MKQRRSSVFERVADEVRFAFLSPSELAERLAENLTEVAQPIGDVPHIRKRFIHTAPEFAVFVVMAR
jgi:hypothetical protein